MPGKALIFPIDSPFEAVAPAGLPTEIHGEPVKYFWKEMLPVKTFRYGDKVEVVDTARIDYLMSSFNKLRAKKFDPPLPPSHDTVGEGDRNLGFLIDVRKGENGSLFGLHQFIGEDAIKTAARSKSSISTMLDVTDEDGEHYDEVIDHNAICSNPHLGGLQDFKPALAASRGRPTSAVVFGPAAPTELSMLTAEQLAKLKTIPGFPADATAENGLDKLIEFATPKAGALTLSKADHDKLVKDAADAIARASTAEADLATKGLELSRLRPKQIDEDTQMLLGETLKTVHKQVIDAGGADALTMAELDKIFMPDGKLNGLALSRPAPTDRPLIFRVYEALVANKPVKKGETMPGQSGQTALELQRQTPGADGGDATAKNLKDAGDAVVKKLTDGKYRRHLAAKE